MNFKCNHCDPTVRRGETPIKTVDTEKHAYIKDENKKYYHLECYRIHLSKKKKMSEEEIDTKVVERLKAQESEMKELEAKNAFLNWIMNFYESSLPSYYMKKLKSVNEGTYEGLNEPIDYLTLLDMYEHLDNFLRKIAMKKRLKTSAQMNYDLAVVVGKYGDYKRFKAKQQVNQVTEKEIDKQTNVDQKVKQASKVEKKEEYDIADYMDELIL